ncbi:MAG TPA: DUF1629 domain-containing protein [Actinomycetota bacterium]|nr:DUF1629 domain-containing protein [Actinomycetota bacterium]
MSGFYLLEMLDEDWAGVALGRDDPALDDILAATTPVENWVPPQMLVYAGKMTDYLPSNVGMRLISKRLRAAIEEAAPGAGIEWLAVSVTDNESQTTSEYWVLHPTEVLDVLDRGASEIARADFVVKPVLDAGKLDGASVFVFSEGDQRVVVSSEVRRSIEAAGCTGVGFTDLPVT